MIKLILMRHGQAAPYCADDAGRDLTEFGAAQAAQSAKQLVATSQLDLIIASPFNRADQTAKIVLENAQQAGQNPSFITLSSITPDDDPAIAIDDIECAIRHKFADDEADKCVAVVCHMPIVARMQALLDGLSPADFALAEYRVLETAVVAPDLACCVASFVPQQP